MPIQVLKGNWRLGWALDLHTTSSSYVAPGEFDTEYTEIGQMLHKLKYQNEKRQIKPLADKLHEFFQDRLATPHVSSIIPVPPSNEDRRFQPVTELANAFGRKLGINVVHDYIQKIKITQTLKSVETKAAKAKILRGVFKLNPDIEPERVGENVLLFDDLYQTGATLSEITKTLNNEKQIRSIYVLTVTKTRTKK